MGALFGGCRKVLFLFTVFNARFIESAVDLLFILVEHCMVRKLPTVDVINDVLQLTLAAYPASDFIKSLLFQYHERGGLGKKQLEGLHSKASKISTMPPGKLATLEAIILKKPTRYKSPLPVAAPIVAKDVRCGQLLEEILTRYPQHKMALFLKAKYDNNEALSVKDVSEIERFYKILVPVKSS